MSGLRTIAGWKRLFAGLLACLSLCMLFAFSETEENVFACTCEKEVCECFIQEGDIGPSVQGVITYLKERGYLSQAHSRGVFDEEVTLAVKAFQKDMDLTETGMLDNETLTLLIFYGMPESMYLWNERAEKLVYIPTDGGIRRHKTADCCGMLSPRKISVLNAEALLMEPCEHCNPE